MGRGQKVLRLIKGGGGKRFDAENFQLPDPHGGGGYSSMILVGTWRWDLKSRPIFIPHFVEKWDPFLHQSHKF